MIQYSFLLAFFITSFLSTPIAASEPTSKIEVSKANLQKENSFDHGVSTFGTLKYAQAFKNFDYVNPLAPQGGEIVMGALGTFDSLNMYIVFGVPAIGLHYANATLLAQSPDEVSSSYGYVAEGVSISQDGKTIAFKLNSNATFDNGSPITAEDVVFSFNILIKEGIPLFRTYYKAVEKIEATDDHTVVFTLKETKSKEMPLILGQLPVLSKKYYATQKFSEPSVKAFPVSGPYKIADVSPGRYIVYEKVDKWWGSNVPSQKGLYNFKRIKVVYYRDQNALFEAFKAGDILFRQEVNAKLWSTAYTFPAVEEGLVKREAVKHSLSTGTQGFAFNTRKPLFQNKKVRKALSMLFDFNWANSNIFYNLYKRSLSYFPNSRFASKGLPTPEEIELLKPFEKDVPETLTTEFKLPEYNDENERREITEKALKLLEEEGWRLHQSKMVNSKGEQFSFEFLIADQAHERVISHFIQTLNRLGIQAKIRLVDASTYQERVDNLDFDMIFMIIPHSNLLGNELRDYFTSVSSAIKGTRNFPGINDKNIDALVEKVIESKDYETLVTRAHALDRTLLNGYYLIPTWYDDAVKIAYWDKFEKPEKVPQYSPINLEAWWFKKEVPDDSAEDNASDGAKAWWDALIDWVKDFF